MSIVSAASKKDRQLLPSSHAADVLGLCMISGLGDEGVAHVWREIRNKGATLDNFYKASASELESEFGLSNSAASYLAAHRREIRAQAADALRRATELDIHILAPGDVNYPARIAAWYDDEPPLLYARGNLDVFSTRTVAILNSAEPPSPTLTNTVGLASRLAEAGCTLITGTENPAYNVIGLAGKRAEGNVIAVLNQGLLTTISRNPDREPIPMARHEDGAFDAQRSLLVSPFRLDGRWQRGNAQRRDKLIAALAKTIVAMEIKCGGHMEALCRQALKRNARLFVSQQQITASGTLANEELVNTGAHPFAPDATGSNCDLLLRDTPFRITPAAQQSDLERRRELGQFFTPELISNFIWDMLEVMHGPGVNRRAAVIDPACGDGVFLRSAVGRGFEREAVVGTDIDETLVELWRKDDTLHRARLYRMNGLLDNPAIGVTEGAFDFVVGNPPFSGRGVRDLLKLVESEHAARPVAEPDFFSAPVLSERSATSNAALPEHERVLLDNLVRHLSRYDCWQLAIDTEDTEQSLSNAMPSDLFAGFEFASERRRVPSDYERMAQLIANWSPDRLLDVSKTEVRDAITRLAATAIEVFFCERFVRLAKPGGLIAFIVPESIVASDQLAPLRTWMVGQMDLLAVVGLPQKVFTGVGANAKTSILFGRRFPSERDENDVAKHHGTNNESTHKVLLTAYRAESNYTLEKYLHGVLASAPCNSGMFRPSKRNATA